MTTAAVQPHGEWKGGPGSGKRRPCDWGGGCDSNAAPDHRLCEWHQGYNAGVSKIGEAAGGYPITVVRRV